MRTLYTGKEWAHRFRWNTRDGFFLTYEAIPDKSRLPLDCVYLSACIVMTATKMHLEATDDDMGRDLYYRAGKLFWNEGGALVGRFMGYKTFNSKRLVVLEIDPLPNTHR